jgi:hypothetical protein
MRLEQYINPHVLQGCRFTGKISNGVWDLRKLVFHNNRFDLVAKLAYGEAYLSGSVTDWRTAQYREHIRAFNNFNEPDGNGKRGEAAFFDTFHSILRADAMAAPCSLNVIPVNQRQMILDGAHRLARAYLRHEPVHLVHFEEAEAASYYDYRFFQRRWLDGDVADSLAFEYGLRNEAAHCLILFPSATRRIADIDSLLGNYFEVFYHKEIRWTERAPHNIITTLYYGEPWLGSFEDGFAGALWKQTCCFDCRRPAHFYVVTPHPDISIIDAKKQLRSLIGVENHSLHSSTSEAEKIRMMRLFLNNNALHWANNAVPAYPKSFISFLRDYRHVKEDSVDACLTGGAVYAAYGMRDVGDLDYIAARPLLPFPGGEANEELLSALLRPLGLGIHDVMEDPRYHFHYFGDKIMALRLCLQIKMRVRKQIKDVVDFARIAMFQTVNIVRDAIPWPLNRIAMRLSRQAARITRAIASRRDYPVAGPYIKRVGRESTASESRPGALHGSQDSAIDAEGRSGLI